MSNTPGNPGSAIDVDLGEVPGLELLDEIVLGSARGGRKRSGPLMLEVVRGLTPEDLPMLADPLGAEPPGIITLKHAHHQLAQLIAKGLEMVEVSLITGYSLSYISNLKHSPTFQELLDFYGQQRQALYVDVLERMRALGLASVEELQGRLTAEPEKWSKKELMDLSRLMFGEGGARPQGAGGGQGNGAGVNIEVKFVSGRGPSNGDIIDVEPTR